MSSQLTATYRGVRCARFKKVREDLPSGGVTIRHHADGYAEGTVEIHIDTDKLIKHYGARAVGSRGKQARIANGAVVLKARNVKEKK